VGSSSLKSNRVASAIRISSRKREQKEGECRHFRLNCRPHVLVRPLMPGNITTSECCAANAPVRHGSFSISQALFQALFSWSYFPTGKWGSWLRWLVGGVVAGLLSRSSGWLGNGMNGGCAAVMRGDGDRAPWARSGRDELRLVTRARPLAGSTTAIIRQRRVSGLSQRLLRLRADDTPTRQPHHPRV
jgi:hypothetical protein